MKKLCIAALMLAGMLCARAEEKAPAIVYINGAKYYIHTVQAGETLYGLAKRYEVGEQVILQHNPAAKQGLRTDEKLRIPVVKSSTEQLPERKLRKNFDFHEVLRGETLYAISRKYEIPIGTLIQDNPDTDPTQLRPGDRILVRRKQIGTEDEAGARAEWEEYRQTLSDATRSQGIAYHIVQPGETFYGLSRRYGITEERLGEMNGGLRPEGLRAGAMLRVPGAEEPEIPRDSVTAPEPAPETARVEEVEFRSLRRTDAARVALLLPLTSGSGTTNGNYVEFYQGFLLGLDSVRMRHGYSVELDLYDTARDTARMEQLLGEEELAAANLIVGPVYGEELAPVVRFAEDRAIPVVSPLAHTEGLNSDVLFQMAPAAGRKYDKAAELIGPQKRITLIYTQHTDREFEREILGLLGAREYDRLVYQYAHPSAAREKTDLAPLLGNGEDNLIVVMADNEVEVDRILASIASANTNLVSRGHTPPRFTVLGNARWNRYANIDRSILFKDRVVMISTYHAKRDSECIRAFDSAYIRAFGSLPSLYAYRGYDAARIFVPGIYNDIEYDMEGRRYAPLQTRYQFGQEGDRLTHVNTEWTRVNYNDDFTITIE